MQLRPNQSPRFYEFSKLSFSTTQSLARFKISMFLVNLVPLLLLVGVLTQSGVDADEHLGEQANNLRGKYFDEQC